MLIDSKFGINEFNIYAKLVAEYGEEEARAIKDKTGPTKLWHSGESENTLTLSIDAINSLFDRYQIEIKDIDNLISVTESPVLPFPGNAAMIASAFPFKREISIFDLNAGCTGFVDAVKICMGLNLNSLIVCSETYSKHIHRFNRATSSLFSDGSCAIYFQPSQWELVDTCSLLKVNTFQHISLSPTNSELIMDGKEVFNFVASDVTPELIRILCENKEITRAYIHQGSKLVVDFLTTKLRKFNLKIPRNIETSGNFVSATIPILMNDDIKKAPILGGESILLAGFGVGLSFSACVIKRK